MIDVIIKGNNLYIDGQFRLPLEFKSKYSSIINRSALH